MQAAAAASSMQCLLSCLCLFALEADIYLRNSLAEPQPYNTHFC